jgi:hypothetical protein
MDAPRTVATFRSSRFCTELPGEPYLNPGCFGQDAARWLARELRAHGIEADAEPEPADFGWYFGLRAGEVECEVGVGWRPGPVAGEGSWVAWIERRANLLRAVLGARHRDAPPALVAALHAALSSAPHVRGLRWHSRRDLAAGRREGAEAPAAS